MAEQDYDHTLTMAHVYLGQGFEEMLGRTVLDTQITHQMMVLGGINVTLIPGETLPLLLYRSEGDSSEAKNWIKQHKIFGLLYPNQECFGTTADLRGFKEFSSHVDGHWGLTVKAEGSQRFEVVEKRLIAAGTYMAEIRILPDIRLLPPGQHLLSGASKLRNLMGKLTPWPECVFNQCREDVLMKEISQDIEAVLGEKPPIRDPMGFSYWVTANLPINDNDRKVLLAANTSQERLFLAKLFLELNCKISCKECHTVISTKEKLFSMSTSGAQGTFVNKHGYTHEMMTVREVTAARYYGASSDEYSWFPGYAWNIFTCAECGVHLGWRFSTEENLQPRKFWGLKRAGVEFVPHKDSDELDNETNSNAGRMARVYLISSQGEDAQNL